MSQDDPDLTENGQSAPDRTRKRRWVMRVLGGLVLIIVAALAVLYFSREDLARDFIEQQLAELELPATYDIEEIGPERQVITNLVIGDPAAPDLTVERVELEPDYGFGSVGVGRITLVRPRLFGTWQDGRPSFGSLDRLIYTDSDEPPGLPALNIALIDGRARLETPYGLIGVKAEGEGPLDSGFNGVLAATAPQLDIVGCAASDATLFGDVSTDGGRPAFTGPLRFDALRCDVSDVRLGDSDFTLELLADEDLAGVELALDGRSDDLAAMDQTARAATVGTDISWRDGRLVADYDLGLEDVAAGGFAIAAIDANGVVRGSDGFDRVEMQARMEGSGLRGDGGINSALNGLIQSSDGTLAKPLLVRLRSGLQRELRDGSFALDVVVRQSGGAITGVVPEARIRGSSGSTLLALSRVQFSANGSGTPSLSANLATGGADIPRITGRMERRAGGTPVFRLAMAEYSAGASRLAIPELSVSQGRGGAYLMDGQVVASGPLPGGSAQNLRIPIDGRWNGGGSFALWRGCTPVTFDRLQYAELALAGQSLTLCPRPGRAIVSQSGGGLSIAATVPSLDLAGRLGSTRMMLDSGVIDLSYPGALAAEELNITLGDPDSAARFRIGNLTAQLGDTITGTFSDADIGLAPVPLDLSETQGNWSYIDGRLTLNDATFTLTDREEVDRFTPLAGRQAMLTLQDNMILAQTVLQVPDTGTELAALEIRHDLTTGTGSADLSVDGIQFGDGLQPDDLTYLAKGVIANAQGVVTGSGEIEWNSAGVTSRGAFSSDDLDFAAAFGPVRGASGTVEFTDLIGLTTAPDQRIFVQSVNPGIEVEDGSIDFRLENGELLDVSGGQLKFAGGDLIVRPLQMRIGQTEVRRYLFEVRGLDSALFVERLELSNIAATGVFDGVLPLVFDEQGNGRIENGLLVSRPPGGNVSYVGDLTYEDMGAMANFAFNALRSLDYQQMTVLMDGPLSGELVTRAEFEGVSQGEGASSNIITRRLAAIPLEFRVNIRAPFSKLIANFAAFSDPALVRDPRELGLLSDDGTRLRRELTGDEVEQQDEAAEVLLEALADPNHGSAPDPSPDTNTEMPIEPPVQGQESDEMP